VAEARTFRNGRIEMLVSSTTYGSRGDVEPVVGFAVQLGALAAAAEEWDTPVATGLVPTGEGQ
jgi:hypothetical protein